MGQPARLKFIPLLGLIYVTVCAGAYGMEPLVSASGPGLAFILILVAPIIWGLPMALAVGELGSTWPVLGGYYRWSRQALGDFWGFQSGWWQLLSAWFDNALYPVLVSSYLVTLYPSVNEFRLPLFAGLEIPGGVLISLLVIAIFTIINVLGVAVVGNLSLIFNVLLILPFVPFVILGLSSWTHNPFVPLAPPGESPFEALGLGMLVIIWGYSGYESLSTAIHEVENPQRDFPRALLWSIPLTVLSYAIPFLAGLAAYGAWQTWEDGTFATAAGAIGGPWLHLAISVGAVVSSIGLFNGYVLGYSRLPAAMAEDGFLPPELSRVNSKFGTPVVAIVFNSVIYAALAFFDFRELLVIDTILFSSGYILIFAALVVMRVKHPDTERPFRVPGGMPGVLACAIVPTIFAVGACVLADFEEIKWGLAAAASGPVVYFLIPAFRWLDRHARRLGRLLLGPAPPPGR